MENTFYHLYNRGVDKRDIFKDERDYKTFLFLLKAYLSPPPRDIPFAKRNTLHQELDLLSFCLMPNHYHLLVKQVTRDGITKLIRRICTNYSMYFNQRYQRIGTLFEGNYKAVIVETDEQLLHLSRYIHLNPQMAGLGKVNEYPYSSYAYFLNRKKANWMKPDEIQSFFSNKLPHLTYDRFVTDHATENRLDQNLILEEGPTL